MKTCIDCSNELKSSDEIYKICPSCIGNRSTLISRLSGKKVEYGTIEILKDRLPINICEYCKDGYSRKTSWQKFCSDSCRVMSFNGEDMVLKLKKRFMDLLKDFYISNESKFKLDELDTRYTAELCRFSEPLRPMLNFSEFEKWYETKLSNFNYESSILGMTRELIKDEFLPAINNIKTGNFVLSNDNVNKTLTGKYIGPNSIIIKDGVYYGRSPDERSYIFNELPVIISRVGLPELEIIIKDGDIYYGLTSSAFIAKHKNPIIRVLKI